jgi:hypothetical protein
MVDYAMEEPTDTEASHDMDRGKTSPDSLDVAGPDLPRGKILAQATASLKPEIRC